MPAASKSKSIEPSALGLKRVKLLEGLPPSMVCRVRRMWTLSKTPWSPP